jgi:hypothetical protein
LLLLDVMMNASFYLILVPFSSAEDPNAFLRLGIDVPSASNSSIDMDSLKNVTLKKKDVVGSERGLASSYTSVGGIDYEVGTAGAESYVRDYERLYVPGGFRPEKICQSDCGLGTPAGWIDFFTN